MSKNTYKLLIIAVLALGLFSGATALPTANDDAYSTNEDTPRIVPAVIGVLFNDVLAGAPVAITIMANPLHGAVVLNVVQNVADGGFTYTPTANYNGADSFTYIVNDGTGDSNVATVTITITAVNDAPVATNDAAYTVAEDVVLTVPVATGVLANDVDVDTGAVLTAVKVTNPLHGAVVLNADGSFTYTPTANYNGADSFTYVANDGTSNSAAATVTIIITAVNDAPVITVPAATSQLKEGQAFALNVAAITADVDAADTKTFSAVPTIPWAGFAITPAGQISITPTAADTGAHLVDIKVTDAAGLTDIKTFRFYVAEACTSTAMSFTTVDITDVTGDDDELLPGDYIEAEFDVKNNLQEDLSDVKVSAWIENLGDGERFSSKVESKKQDIDSRESKSLSMKLRLDLDAARTENVKSTQVLYMRAEGDDKNGTAQCLVYQKDLSVERLADNVLIEKVEFSPEEPVCSGSVSMSAQLFNIGRSSPDDITLRFKNNALGLDKTTGAFELASSGRDAKAAKAVNFELPATAKAGDYPVEIIATFNDGEDVETVTNTLKVGACEATGLAAVAGTAQTAAAGQSTIAVSQSSAVAKREEAVKYTITLTNTQASLASYQFDLTGIADWATGMVEPEDITLAPGASMPVYVYLTPKADASGGEHTGSLSVKSGATVLDSKTLTANVQVPTTVVKGFGNNAILGAAAGLNFGSVNRDSALFVVLFIVVLVFAGFLYARDRNRKASKVEIIK